MLLNKDTVKEIHKMSFKNLKKKRPAIAELAAKLENQGKKTYEQDDRYWYPKRDDNGNGYATIRFLPAPLEEASAYVQTFRHGYKGPNGWYIEECPTTIGEKCPVCEANGVLYDTKGKEYASTIVSGMNGRKRKMQYVANIFIISDPETPENNGKVMLYRFGAKIFDKIKLAVSPEFGETPFDPFDMWEGADFQLKIRKVDGNVNYDMSQFKEPSQFLKTDKAMEEAYNLEYSLEEIIAPDKYKPYEDLAKRFNQVSGADTQSGQTAHASAPSQSATANVIPTVAEVEPDEVSEEDADTLDFFKKMVDKG